MAEMKIGDETFHVELGGDEKAPPLILSNSLGSNLRMWEAQMPELNRHFRTIRYDSRGHGASVAPDRPYSIAELAADALAILDELGVRRAHWLGLSKGGMVGQWLLTHHRDRIGRAILANTASSTGTPGHWNERIRMAREDGLAALGPTIIGRWFTPRFLQKNPEEAARISDMFARTPPHGYAGCCAAIRDMDQSESVRSISNPVLVIVGRHDPSTTPEAGAALAKSIPGAKLKALNAAHLSNIEQPEAFTNAVVDFLNEDKASAPGKPASRKTAAKSTAKRSAKSTAKKAAKKTTTKKTASKTVKKAAKTRGAGKAVAAKKATKKSTQKAAPKAARKATRKAAAKATGKSVAAKRAPQKKTTAGKAAIRKSPAATARRSSAATKTARKGAGKKKTGRKK